MARERVLITGASGFLGANLTRALIAADCDVHLVLRGPGISWRLAGLEGQYISHPADIRDASALRRAMRSCRPEVIYHLATYGVSPSQRDEVALLQTNVVGTANLLEAARGLDYRALVHVGTGAEYGPRDYPVGEEEFLAPQTAYAKTKAAAARLCQLEARGGLPVVIVRVFSAYGPWEEAGRLTSYVMGCCLRGEPVRVSPGLQRRDFIAAEDVIALLRMAAAGPEAAGQVLHAATGQEASVRDMVETIVAVSGRRDVPIEFGARPVRPDEPSRYVGRNERTQTLTGWAPRYDLKTGVEKMWAWFTTTMQSQAA